MLVTIVMVMIATIVAIATIIMVMITFAFDLQLLSALVGQMCAIAMYATFPHQESKPS